MLCQNEVTEKSNLYGLLLKGVLMLWLVTGAAFAGELAITNANIIPITSPPIANASIVIQDGKILSVGTDIEIPPGIEV